MNHGYHRCDNNLEVQSVIQLIRSALLSHGQLINHLQKLISTSSKGICSLIFVCILLDCTASFRVMVHPYIHCMQDNDFSS